MFDARFMRLALQLARRGYGLTSPNPMVGAVLVKGDRILGRGWHRRAGEPHAEVEGIRDAQRRGHSVKGTTLYVTLEPCCTYGCTPPCTEAIIAAGIQRVVIGVIDLNPEHAGRGLRILRRAGIEVETLVARPGRDRGSSRLAERTLANECARLNEAFNHWIVHRTPFVTVKAAMTLDGKIATVTGESKWITGEQSRAYAMKLRQGSDAILVGINTVLADDPELTVRPLGRWSVNAPRPVPRRIVLDSMARTPRSARVVTDGYAAKTTIVVSRRAPQDRVAALARRVRVTVCPVSGRASHSGCGASQVDLSLLLKVLGAEGVTSLLVEGGGEVNASFLFGGLAHRVAFFYAPKILGGRDSRRAVGGDGGRRLSEVPDLTDVEWRRLGPDLLLTARVGEIGEGVSQVRKP